MSHAAFALLDDCQAHPGQPSSRLYQHWHSRLICTDAATLDAWEQQLQQALAAGLHAIVLADYEWGLQLQGLPHTPPEGAPTPCLRAELFDHMQRLDKQQVDAWLAAQCRSHAERTDQVSAQAPGTPGAPDEPAAGLLAWHASLDSQAFAQRIARIHQAIACGDTYQINFTFALHGRSWGQPLALYQRLRARQPSRYGALLHLPADEPANANDAQAPGQWVLSLSPELFLRCQGGRIQAQPMKGTAAAPAGDDPAQLQAAAQRLSQDAKSRAENIMIVDLLRNDLGRIAQTGSVQAPALFEVQRNGRVLGMTSTISAQLRPGMGLAQVLRASFPCGSITGAPKRKAMQYIDELERTSPPTPRGLYTGALGWVERSAQADPAADANANADASGAPTLDFCLSIPIRTLQLQGPASTGPALPSHHARLHVGAGIVWDSQAEQEWQECQLKAGFAVQDMAGLALFETMLLPTHASLPQHWALHCERLQRSAQALGFASDVPGWQARLQAYIAQQRPSAAPGPWRLRLTLHQGGQLDIEHTVLAGPEAQLAQPVGLLLSPQPSRVPTRLRQHKTTLRQDYDAALRQAMAQGAFDCLFFNEQGLLTEGARSNVFVQLDDAPDAPWLTPPVSDGLLPGIQRQLLLNSPEWHCQERSIHRQELLTAKRVLVCNALRGILQAQVPPPQGAAPAQQTLG
ncbi:bifunctional chorismate-binding protein/class IV aminotransferase [Vandammella animalimorsus]|uniref:Chorismate-utilising enzyme C-terminal domain-containing protein n=1 Tax=Vandammella animalimorsus TaxID=2029117 RepID=A0A2A2B006_9BURK|nr:bifunctional anthranilate synthase component I family protein/class IV aminotransferase [Vandammella animalimorsus]PAT43353.1 hypothetical protein CK621_04225 [Vandammella animalimorsus]